MELSDNLNKLNQEDQESGTNKQTDKQTSGTLGKKIILGVFAVPMILLNIFLNAVQSVGRRAKELLWEIFILSVVVEVAKHAVFAFAFPFVLFAPESWTGKVLCCLGALVCSIVWTKLMAIHLLRRNVAVEILKTPILLLVSAGAWIYNSFVGFVCLFKNVGKDDILVSDRYQDLGCDLDAIQKQSIIKKLANITVPAEDEKAQPVSFTQAAVRYTLGVVDVKSKDEVKKRQWIELGDENEVQKTEYIVKPKSFPYRTGGYMIY